MQLTLCHLGLIFDFLSFCPIQITCSRSSQLFSLALKENITNACGRLKTVLQTAEGNEDRES